MTSLFALALLWQAGDAISAWQQEIEQEGKAPVVIARVYRDRAQNTITLPPETPQRELVKSYLQKEEFVRNLMDAHALLISHRDNFGMTHLIVLNMDRAGEWASEDAIIAHELGHAWLKARGYPAPILQDGPTMCLGIHTGDVVQHILIRAEMERRGIDYRTGWLRDLDAALEGMEKDPAMPTEPCKRLRLAALWLDVRLGLSPQAWPNYSRFERLMTARAAWMKLFIDQIDAYLRGIDAADKTAHRQALDYIFARLKLIAQGTEMAGPAGCPACSFAPPGRATL